MVTPTKFAEAYESSFTRTVRFLQSRGVTPEIAEEVAQVAWVRGWERQEQLQSESSLVPWINSIALNALRGYFRRQARAPQLLDSTASELLASEPISPDDRHDLRKVLARCSPEEQQLLWAYWGEGHTSKEIAAKMEIKPVSVRVRIGRLVKKLDNAFGRDLSVRRQLGNAHPAAA